MEATDMIQFNLLLFCTPRLWQPLLFPLSLCLKITTRTRTEKQFQTTQAPILNDPTTSEMVQDHSHHRYTNENACRVRGNTSYTSLLFLCQSENKQNKTGRCWLEVFLPWSRSKKESTRICRKTKQNKSQKTKQTKANLYSLLFFFFFFY